MIEIDNNVYKTIAQIVKNSIYEFGFINKTLCITIQSENATKIKISLSFGALSKVCLSTPVWWECQTESGGKQIDNDFSWGDMLQFI